MSGDASQTPFLFNGLYGVMTDDNGLYYMRAQYYNPEIKRFINQDILLGGVVEGQTLNRFAYVNGNPISFTDPEGKLAWWIIPLIGFGLTIADIAIPPTLPEGHEQDAITLSIGPFDLITGIGSGVTGSIRVCRSVVPLATNVTGGWKTLPGGVRIKQVGNYWVKELNPNASKLAQWWGRGTLNAQARGLGKLGDMAPSFLYKNGRLITRDAGK